MIENKRKNINEMVKEVNLNLTNKIEVIQEIDKFIERNNLVYNEKVNIEEMKHIFSENKHNAQKVRSNTGVVMDNIVYFHNQNIYSAIKEADRLMRVFITYINNNFEFDKENINTLRLKLYLIFFPRVMNEEIKSNVSLLEVKNKESEKMEKFDKDIKIGFTLLLILGFLLMIGALTIPFAIV